MAASLRLGLWNDAQAPVQPLELDELLPIVQSFACAIYGWEFFDLDASWLDRTSLDIALSESRAAHSLWLFQEGGGDRHLDLAIWFDAIEFRDSSGAPVAQDEVIAGGRRWWDAFFQHDPRTRGSGMFPLKS